MNDEIIVDNKKGEKIMTNEEILLLTKRTLSRGEMVDFLQGKGIYHCTPNKYLPAYIPTDFERILKQGILAYMVMLFKFGLHIPTLHLLLW